MDSQAKLHVWPASVPSVEETMSENAAVKIQAIHRGHLIRTALSE